MTHTIRPTDKRGPSSQEQRPWWRSPWLILALTVVFLVAVIVVVASLWPEEEPAEETALATTGAASATTTPPTTEAPFTTEPPAISAVEAGMLAWAPASEPPSGQVLAVTAMDAGYLAASHGADGVEFWVSDTGDGWTLLAEDLEAFRPNYQVYVLDSGPSGFTAEAFDPTADNSMGTNTVFASTDGANWYRTELNGELPESPSPYLIQHSVVHEVVIGPDGFLAVGSGSLMPDFDLIAAEYAPGYSAEDVWAVDAEARPEGGVLIIGFGDEEPLEIPFSELGIETDLAVIFGDEGEMPISQFLWWSADGESWEQVTPQGLPEFWLMHFVYGAVGADDGFYLFSADPDPSDPEGPRTMSGYHSADGRVWTQFALEGPAEDWMQEEWLTTVNYGNGLFVAVGDHEGDRALWTSTDARVWERAPGSESLFAGLAGDYEIEEIDIGGAGYVAVGHVWGEEEMYPTVPVEPVIVKEGYAVTFGEDGITIENQTTGVLEVLDMEAGRSETIEVIGDETGMTFVDIASGETLLVITNRELDVAWEELAGEMGAMDQPTDQTFRFSTDLANWTLDTAQDLFGEGTFAVSGDMDGDTVLAVAASDQQRWDEERDRRLVSPTVIWVGTPGG